MSCKSAARSWPGRQARRSNAPSQYFARRSKQALRPGATAADVARAENDVFRKQGLGDYTTSKWTRVRGHGLGLFCDSKPHLLEDVDTPLVPGMTLIVHPNTYHPEVGYMVLGDAVVVT
ncbi:MAG: M24 family metallopeptidase, partial [Alphaproteobacteria bacterium]